MLPDPPRRGLEGMVYALSLMLRHQAVGVLSLLREGHTILYLPAPCPLPVAPHDFGRSAELITMGYAEVKPFLASLRVEKSGIYGHPHFH